MVVKSSRSIVSGVLFATTAASSCLTVSAFSPPVPHSRISLFPPCHRATVRSIGKTAYSHCGLFFDHAPLPGGGPTVAACGRRPQSTLLRGASLSDAPSDEDDTPPITSSPPPDPVASRRSAVLRPFILAGKKFRADWKTYCAIPLVAAAVGWITNWMAVQMIFYPIKYRGLNIYRQVGSPLGLIGWQGIVPTKTVKMSETLVEMVTSQLLSVQEVFGRLDPRKIAKLLGPEVPKLTKSIASDILPKVFGRPMVEEAAEAAVMGLPGRALEIISHFNRRFLIGFTKDMQANIGDLLNLRNCVVEQMMADRSLLGKLFQRCGSAELKFLTDSGLWFGFLLGLIQMVVALFWDNPWSMSIGGTIVGYATNWLALKWIFEPVNPMKIGPFVFQGLFLTRQKEVSAEFANFFSNNVLTSEKIWHSILTDPSTSPNFQALFATHLKKFINRVTMGLALRPEPEVLNLAARKAVEKLPSHVGVLHGYIDKTLGLEASLRVKMEGMTSLQFERVLHPIFEEDELTLILAGAALGFVAGYIQQLLSTGQLTLPTRVEAREFVCSVPGRVRRIPGRVARMPAEAGDWVRSVPDKIENICVGASKVPERASRRLRSTTAAVINFRPWRGGRRNSTPENRDADPDTDSKENPSPIKD